MVQLHDLDGYLAQAAKPIGAVIVLPMFQGLNHSVKDLAGRLADWGLSAVVWNPYPGHPNIPRDEAAKRAVLLKDNVMVAQISAWMTYMQEVRKIRSVATIGFSMGARVALLHASHDRRVAGLAAFYPAVTVPRPQYQDLDVMELAKEVRCPVFITQPANDDKTAHETYMKLRAVLLSRHGVPTSIGFFPDAEHDFMELDQHPGHANELAAKLAWNQALGFLRASVS